MGYDVVLANEFLPLECAEAMLFIDNNVSKILKYNLTLDERMGTYQDGDFSVRYPLQKLSS